MPNPSKGASVVGLRRRRQRLRTDYRRRLAELTALLFQHDPASLNFGSNADEYEPEAGSLLPRLVTCRSAEDTAVVVHEEFLRWFGPAIGGSVDTHAPVARAIWAWWQAQPPPEP